MHYDYLEKKNKPKIDGNYIRKVSKKFYPGIQEVLANLESLDTIEELLDIRSFAEEKIEIIRDSVMQEQEMKNTMSNTTETENIIKLANVAANIKSMYDEYTDSQIETAYNKVIGRKSSEGKSEKEISRKVLEQLQKIPKRSNKRNTVESPDIICLVLKHVISITVC